MTQAQNACLAGATSEEVVGCEGLTMVFGGRGRTIRVLDGVDLSVSQGEVVVISGRVGSGKSTLLSLLAGLERPTSGCVRVEGRPLEGLSSAQLARLRRERIGIVFQSFNLLPAWTARENVEAALVHTVADPRARSERAGILLAALGLADRLHHLPAELSVGQQQGVAIARALAGDPAVVLADEPTGDVDPETAEEIVAHLTRPVREKGVTLIVATHGSFPAEQAYRVLRLEAGRLVPATDR